MAQYIVSREIFENLLPGCRIIKNYLFGKICILSIPIKQQKILQTKGKGFGGYKSYNFFDYRS